MRALFGDLNDLVMEELFGRLGGFWDFWDLGGRSLPESYADTFTARLLFPLCPTGDSGTEIATSESRM